MNPGAPPGPTAGHFLGAPQCRLDGQVQAQPSTWSLNKTRCRSRLNYGPNARGTSRVTPAYSECRFPASWHVDTAATSNVSGVEVMSPPKTGFNNVVIPRQWKLETMSMTRSRFVHSARPLAENSQSLVLIGVSAFLCGKGLTR